MYSPSRPPLSLPSRSPSFYSNPEPIVLSPTPQQSFCSRTLEIPSFHVTGWICLSGYPRICTHTCTQTHTRMHALTNAFAFKMSPPTLSLVSEILLYQLFLSFSMLQRLELAKQAGDKPAINRSYNNLANAHLFHQHLDKAETYFT